MRSVVTGLLMWMAVGGGVAQGHQMVVHLRDGSAATLGTSTIRRLETVVGSPLEAPVVAINLASANQVLLSWPAVAGAAGYAVYEVSTAGGAETLLATPTEPSILLAAAPDQVRLLRVRARN